MEGYDMSRGMYLGLKPKDVKEDVWCAVIEAWKNGLSDREAAFRASAYTEIQVKASDIQTWKRENSDIKELCEMLKDDIKATAKINVKNLLDNGDDKTSRWYLEHRCPEEFSTKAAVAFEGAAIEVSLDDKDKALKELVEQYKAGRDGK